MTEMKGAIVPMYSFIQRLGEALNERCPNDDCMVYRNVYNTRQRMLNDYQRILQFVPDADDSTLLAIRAQINRYGGVLLEMYRNNYAVNCYLNDCGMRYSCRC